MPEISYNEFGDVIWDASISHPKYVKPHAYGNAYQKPVFNIGEVVEFCIPPDYSTKHRGVIQSREHKINSHTGSSVEAFHVLGDDNTLHHIFYWSLYKVNEGAGSGFTDDEFYGSY